MARAYYTDSIESFLAADANAILGRLTQAHVFTLEPSQRDAWRTQIEILKSVLCKHNGAISFEFDIPRMGRRIDTVLLIGPAVFVLEFKVGETEFHQHSIDQVWDYALDLKNFHEPSHSAFIAPILIATDANVDHQLVIATPQNDKLLLPIKASSESLASVIESVLQFAEGPAIESSEWNSGRYHPTPTIVEAAMALYAGHSVHDISRSDAGAINLSQTSDAVSKIIALARRDRRKAICFVTGVPGAGKTLVGLNIATKHIDKESELYSVFLSGNGPLVQILCEALARDKVRIDRAHGRKVKKGSVLSDVKMFIQNVHHFRDDCLDDEAKPPIEHVALFDEAQRAWNLEKTADFMRRKKGRPNFPQSEPEFLISCIDRHTDWGVVVCLVGGGQEINSGEAGISEWIDSLQRSFKNWDIHISPQLIDSEYGAGRVLKELEARSGVYYNESLHLGVSMRSFRAEHVSLLIKQLLDLRPIEARATFDRIHAKYPVVISRDVTVAKKWVRAQARGSERYGLVASSQAQRLKPHAIDVRVTTDPVHWFLDGKNDVRSSYYLEDAATEFDIQGLELDWACVTWDADFRYAKGHWEHRSFCGDRWNNINKPERQAYLKNAYRVLLTRARQGMVIVVPNGDTNDPTRKAEYYDPTFEYLREIGFPVIS